MQKNKDGILKDLKGKRILITGGLGFIGSNLAHKCLELGAEVAIYDCLDPRSGGNMFNIHTIRKSVQMVLSDILHFDDLCYHVLDKDIIFNCAASTSHPYSMRDPLSNIDINSKGVISILEALRRFNSDAKLVHLGTTSQIGALHYTPADEKHPEFPTDLYSANKSAAEKYVLIYCKVYKIPATVVRLPNVFGPRATIHSNEFNFVNYFIGLGLQNKDITIYGKGQQLRNLLYVDDCVTALLTAAQNPKANGEVFFAVGNEAMSVAEIAKAIEKYIGGRVKSIEWPKDREAIDVGDAVISNGKIRRTLNWEPRQNFADGLVKTKEFFNSCLEKYLR